MARRVIVDQDECIGCGTCEGICPEVFELNEEIGKSQIIDPEGAPEDLIQEAIDSCPVEAIHWEECRLRVAVSMAQSSRLES